MIMDKLARYQPPPTINPPTGSISVPECTLSVRELEYLLEQAKRIRNEYHTACMAAFHFDGKRLYETRQREAYTGLQNEFNEGWLKLIREEDSLL